MKQAGKSVRKRLHDESQPYFRTSIATLDRSVPQSENTFVCALDRRRRTTINRNTTRSRSVLSLPALSLRGDDVVFLSAHARV